MNLLKREMHKRPTFDELIGTVTDPEKKKLIDAPERSATFLRADPRLTHFDDTEFADLSEQQNKINLARLQETKRLTMTATTGSQYSIPEPTTIFDIYEEADDAHDVEHAIAEQVEEIEAAKKTASDLVKKNLGEHIDGANPTYVHQLSQQSVQPKDQPKDQPKTSAVASSSAAASSSSAPASSSSAPAPAPPKDRERGRPPKITPVAEEEQQEKQTVRSIDIKKQFLKRDKSAPPLREQAKAKPKPKARSRSVARTIEIEQPTQQQATAKASASAPSASSSAPTQQQATAKASASAPSASSSAVASAPKITGKSKTWWGRQTTSTLKQQSELRGRHFLEHETKGKAKFSKKDYLREFIKLGDL